MLSTKAALALLLIVSKEALKTSFWMDAKTHLSSGS
jgi:hypothetical protein